MMDGWFDCLSSVFVNDLKGIVSPRISKDAVRYESVCKRQKHHIEKGYRRHY
jgi:hypothetical protein